MTISFHGNHLYTVPSNKQYSTYCQIRETEGLNSRKVNRIDDNKILVLDGQDYKNYEQAVHMTGGALGVPAHEEILKGYADQAIKVDLVKKLRNVDYII